MYGVQRLINITVTENNAMLVTVTSAKSLKQNRKICTRYFSYVYECISLFVYVYKMKPNTLSIMYVYTYMYTFIHTHMDIYAVTMYGMIDRPSAWLKGERSLGWDIANYSTVEWQRRLRRHWQQHSKITSYTHKQGIFQGLKFECSPLSSPFDKSVLAINVDIVNTCWRTDSYIK